MAMKPVDKRGSKNRDGMWHAMLELGTFTIKEIGRRSQVNKGTIADYLIGLEKAGFVSVERERIRSNQTQNTYTVIRPEPETPRVRKDGTLVTQGLGTEQMWRSMKLLKQFTHVDLALHASTDTVGVSVETAKTYVSYLLKAGYLQIITPSTPHRQAVYCLAYGQNTGPRPPQIQRVKQVFDPNLDKVVWPMEDDNG